MTYAFPGFTLMFDPATGEAITRYPDGHVSGCGVVDGDRFHAPRLGITPKRHRLAHELIHHLVGIHVLGWPDSPVIRRDAHGIPQPDPDPSNEEWLVTALTYFAHDRPMHNGPGGYGAIHDIAKRADPLWLRRRIRYLMLAVDQGVERLELSDGPGAEEAVA